MESPLLHILDHISALTIFFFHFYTRIKLAYVSLASVDFKAAYSVTFDLLILKIMFLFFKNGVKILKFR